MNEITHRLTGDQLLSFISGSQTNIGKSTYYNMKEEQRQAMLGQHIPVFNNARPFYTLMTLPPGTNDTNKQLITWNLINHTLRKEDLKDHEHDPTTKWENEIIMQAFENIPITRIFGFFMHLQERKINKKRAIYLINRYLNEHHKSWGLWAIKYRTQFKRILRHIHAGKGPLHSIYMYLRNKEINGVPQIIKDYEDVRSGNQDKLAALPSSVAEGFRKGFGLSTKQFWDLYTKKGGRFTAKEKQVKARSVAKAGSSTELDLRKLKLFDLLVHLKANGFSNKTEIKKLLKAKAKEEAGKLAFKLKNVGLVLDTSQSMFGASDQPFHPLLRGLGISLILKECSTNFKEYRTNGGNKIIPELGNRSNYADSVLEALKDGSETIVVVGDGYENSPYEGAVHEILFIYKKKVNPDLFVFHLNPVFASEAMDVRSLSNLAPQMGIRQMEGLNESLFLAMAKQNPTLAIKNYCKYLMTLMNEKVKQLTPRGLKLLQE